MKEEPAMILFPQPRQLELLEGTYTLPLAEETRELTAFFAAVKGGMAGVSFTFSPMLAKA